MVRAMVLALRIAVMATALAPVVLVSLQSLHSPLAAVPTRSRSQIASPIQTSLEPEVAVRGGTPEEHRRLKRALDRFASNGLHLPELEVEFRDDGDACNGHIGLFRPGHTPWRVRIGAGSVDSVYEHELAHACELANLTDETRRNFMGIRDFSTWADKGVPWNERGIEGVAIVIQQGLAGLPLPPRLSTEHQSRLAAYDLLTDQPAPRLLEWCAARSERRTLPLDPNCHIPSMEVPHADAGQNDREGDMIDTSTLCTWFSTDDPALVTQGREAPQPTEPPLGTSVENHGRAFRLPLFREGHAAARLAHLPGKEVLPGPVPHSPVRGQVGSRERGTAPGEPLVSDIGQSAAPARHAVPA